MRVRLLSLALTLAAGRCALAVPIDCSKAVKPVDRTICADPFLLQTDARLDTLYDVSSRMVTPSERDTLLETQRAWVKSRETCGADKNCLRGAYAQRATVFEEILKRVAAAGPF